MLLRHWLPGCKPHAGRCARKSPTRWPRAGHGLDSRRCVRGFMALASSAYPNRCGHLHTQIRQHAQVGKANFTTTTPWDPKIRPRVAQAAGRDSGPESAHSLGFPPTHTRADLAYPETGTPTLAMAVRSHSPVAAGRRVGAAQRWRLAAQKPGCLPARPILRPAPRGVLGRAWPAGSRRAHA